MVETSCFKVRKNGQQKTCNLFCNIASKRVELTTPENTITYHNALCLSLWAVKRATSLFNSFCSNVAKQVARFWLPVFPYLY